MPQAAGSGAHPPVGYTVAIEYAFYVFFTLCLIAMLSGLLSGKLRIDKRHAACEAVDLGVKLTYAAAVAATIAG